MNNRDMFLRLLCLLLVLFTGCQEYTIDNINEPAFMEAGSKVDILTITDASCSMGDDWIMTQYNLVKFADGLTAHDIKWQLAVTPMDLKKYVWFPTDPETDTEPLFHEVYRKDDTAWEVSLALREIASDFSYFGETGFDAAIHRKQQHSEWFRKDAATILIFVGDEEEQSESTATELYNAWSGEELYIVSIVGPKSQEIADSNKELNYCYANYAPLYREVSHIAIDICDDAPWRLYSKVESLSR